MGTNRKNKNARKDKPASQLDSPEPMETKGDDVRLLSRAVREGWLNQRWPTRMTVEEFVESVEGRSLTLAEKIIRDSHTILSSGETRHKIDVMKLGVRMEAQNLREDLAVMSHRSQNPEIPVSPVTVNQPKVVMICPSNGRGPTPDELSQLGVNGGD